MLFAYATIFNATIMTPESVKLEKSEVISKLAQNAQ
jgi:hypothetical protein